MHSEVLLVTLTPAYIDIAVVTVGCRLPAQMAANMLSSHHCPCLWQHKSARLCLQALGDMLSQGPSGQTFEAQAEANEQPYSPEAFVKSAAVSRRGSAAMPSAALKAPAASRRGSTAAAVPMDSEYTDEVKTSSVLQTSMQSMPCFTD